VPQLPALNGSGYKINSKNTIINIFLPLTTFLKKKIVKKNRFLSGILVKRTAPPTPYVRHSPDCTCCDFGHLQFLLLLTCTVLANFVQFLPISVVRVISFNFLSFLVLFNIILDKLDLSGLVFLVYSSIAIWQSRQVCCC
jgi:hypothetical protein